jgi:NAD(P)-dependent dehydrogenase (short-subunit alcohol dehydrogenase family)
MARTVVITGAGAGVGRATAVAFGRRGDKVALIARGRDRLDAAAREVREAGGEALVVVADVADAGAIDAAAERIERELGDIDIWVNDAMATMFAPLQDITPDEFRRVTEVTYLGQVFGTMAALKRMRRRDRGTIVQVGSALSYRAIPLQSAYCGAKFAIRGFTDALRSELEHQRSKIRLTMVQLPAVNTPQFDWARNRLAKAVQPVPPVYQPEAVARQIVRAAEQAPRELWVGFPALKAILGTMLVPGTADRILASEGYGGQMTAEPRPYDRPDNLFAPVPGEPGAHGRFDEVARREVAGFDAQWVRAGLAVGVLGALAAAFALGRAGRRKPAPRRAVPHRTLLKGPWR